MKAHNKIPYITNVTNANVDLYQRYSGQLALDIANVSTACPPPGPTQKCQSHSPDDGIQQMHE